MKGTLASRALALAIAAVAAIPAAAQEKKADPMVARGRYLIQIGGCNDCHTAGYPQTGGKVPEAQWLTGDGLGWRGPWGTTYAINLRLYMQDLTCTTSRAGGQAGARLSAARQDAAAAFRAVPRAA